jgi:hypothetical protein
MSRFRGKSFGFCVLLASASLTPIKLHAQLSNPLEVVTPQGDDVIAVHVSGGDNTMFDLYDKKNLTLRIATYDMSTEKMSNVDLDSADEVKRIVAGKGHNIVTRYQGPAPTPTSLPKQTPTGGVPSITVAPAGNPLEVHPTFDIVSADANKAVLKVTLSSKEYTLKIEASHKGSGTLKAWGDALDKSLLAKSDNDSLSTLRGADSVRMTVTDGLGEHIAMYYKPDGTPLNVEARGSGNTTRRIMSYWSKDTFVNMADKLAAFVQAQGKTATYTNALYGIGGKPLTNAADASAAGTK